MGRFSAAPVRIAAIILAKYMSVMLSAPTRSEADVAEWPETTLIFWQLGSFHSLNYGGR